MAQTPRKPEGVRNANAACMTSPAFAPFTPGSDVPQEKVRQSLPRKSGCRGQGQILFPWPACSGSRQRSRQQTCPAPAELELLISRPKTQEQRLTIPTRDLGLCYATSKPRRQASISFSAANPVIICKSLPAGRVHAMIMTLSLAAARPFRLRFWLYPPAL